MEAGKKSSAGFSLIETSMVMVLIVILLGAGLVFHQGLRKSTDQLFKRQYAIKLATSQMEDLAYLAATEFSAPMGSITPGMHGVPTANVQPLVRPGYGLTYTVSDRDLPDDGDSGVNPAPPPAGNGADYKIIRITVTYPGNHSLRIDGVVFEP